MTPTLHKAIEGVYEAFRDVPVPTTVIGCPCCFDDKGINILLTKPLRELSGDDLTHYASSVFLTVGAVEDFLYFLPRILEILASKKYWSPDPEVVTHAIHTSGYHSWVDVRRQAVLRYFEEVISDLLASEGTGRELDSWVCALGRLHVDLTPFLVRIASKPAHLVEFFEANSRQLMDGRLSNSFWDDAPEEKKQVIDWLQSPETRKAIEMQYGFAR